MNCPCCGQPVENVGLAMLAQMKLGGQERALLSEMVRVYPDGVPHERMMDVLFMNDRDGGPLNPSQHVSVVMSRLRPRVEATGAWTIPIAYKNGLHRLVRCSVT